MFRFFMMERNIYLNQKAFRPGANKVTGDCSPHELQVNKDSESMSRHDSLKPPSRKESNSLGRNVSKNRGAHGKGQMRVDSRTPHSVERAKGFKHQLAGQRWRERINAELTRQCDRDGFCVVDCVCNANTIVVPENSQTDGFYLCKVCRDICDMGLSSPSALSSAVVGPSELPSVVQPTELKEPVAAVSPVPPGEPEPLAAPSLVEMVLPSRVVIDSQSWYDWFLVNSLSRDVVVASFCWLVAAYVLRISDGARIYFHRNAFMDGGSDWVSAFCLYDVYLSLQAFSYLGAWVLCAYGVKLVVCAILRWRGSRSDSFQLAIMPKHREVSIKGSYYELLKDKPRSVVTVSLVCPELARWVDRKHPCVNWQVYDTFRRVKADIIKECYLYDSLPEDTREQIIQETLNEAYWRSTMLAAAWTGETGVSAGIPVSPFL